jgi:capsular polysaccharide biosynthesis protein
LIPEIDDTRVFHAKRIYYCRTRSPYGQRVAHLSELLGAPEALSDADDRIFLTRRPPHGRRLANDAEVEAYLGGLGFRTVDSAALSIEEQMAIFTRVRYLVAVHGAGITNIIFRGGRPLSVLDLHSYRYPGPGDMARISRELGYTYAQLGGPGESPEEDHAHFSIDMTELKRAVDEMMLH